ncbi:MAG TPA: hypothetical protein VK821_04610 [Dehalococcoidia bacterium]|nr:hypothetical protein [Dehalococcoidia bacterium]
MCFRSGVRLRGHQPSSPSELPDFLGVTERPALQAGKVTVFVGMQVAAATVAALEYEHLSPPIPLCWSL